MKNLNTNHHSNYWVFVFMILILLYLMVGTGLHGDDYSVIRPWHEANFFILTPENIGLKIFGIPDYFAFWWVYLSLGHNYQWAYDILKCVIHISSIYMAWRFFSLYFINSKRALAASIFFTLLPLHETTTYWYMTASYIFWPSVIMFSFYFFFKNKLKLGFILGTLGAFSGYVSPPYIFGLSVIFFRRKEYFKGLIFIIPGIFYIIYYFYIKIVFPFAEKRINPDLDLLLFFKGMIIQIFGVFDSFIGPSAFIKLYYAALSVGLLSLSIAMLILFIMLHQFKQLNIKERSKYKESRFHDLLIGATSVLILSMAMFSLTGLYAPSPFNLGNRSLVYGSILVASLLASFSINRFNLVVIWILFIIPTFGLSDHWKSWNDKQLNILFNISSHKEFSYLKANDTLIVTGQIYNKLGPFSHIEFFSMPWVVNSIFRDFAGVEHAISINQTIYLDGDLLKDEKFGLNYKITGKIYIYDCDRNTVQSGTFEDIRNLIIYRTPEIRHWIQLMKGSFIEKLILTLSPRLNYLFVK